MSLRKKQVKKFIDLCVDHWDRICQKLSPQNAGHRLFPSRTPKHDEDTGARVDQGLKHSKNGTQSDDTYNIHIQANNQGPASHGNLFTVEVRPTMSKTAFKSSMEKAARDAGVIWVMASS
ncbi:hypothetical protein PV05_03412 [Exophiala xenobiotica]|uniref:Uncharacterized protein n=1 Tax=Exophiala xenobiotica TaxID=348802 RepID=A0A0D2FFN5_9EURO|nr:uncharacterized protein PV05_03412 [Exophiala xenobiotica]KIW58919.1 hypothetical protein PV05_03412 [Exophiala xenobiotica]